MRVLAALHLYSPYHNAGAETMVHALLKALVSAGHQVVVQMSMPHPMHHVDPYVYEGVQVFPYVQSNDLWRWCTTPELKPDLLITHLDTALQATMIHQLTKIPLINVIHNTHEATKHILERGASLAVFNTEWMRADYESWGLAPRHIVLHPPVHREQYTTTPPARNGAVTLVNLTEPKGAKVFYALAERLPSRRFIGVQGAYGKQIIRTDLANVEIMSHVAAHDMPKQVYAKTRVLLAPSVYESYGRVVVEAACSGIPSVAHPTPGLLEALGSNGGIFCDRDDLGQWLDALQRLRTAAGWTVASHAARKVAEGLTTDADLARWVEAAEVTAGVAANAGAAV